MATLHGLGDLCQVEGDLSVALRHLEEFLQMDRTIHGDLPRREIAASSHGLGNLGFPLGARLTADRANLELCRPRTALFAG